MLIISDRIVEGDVIGAAQIVIAFQRGHGALCLGGQRDGHVPVPVVVTGCGGGGVLLIHHDPLIVEGLVGGLALRQDEAQVQVYGNYVVYGMLSEANRTALFNEVKQLLLDA